MQRALCCTRSKVGFRCTKQFLTLTMQKTPKLNEVNLPLSRQTEFRGGMAPHIVDIFSG